MSKTIFKSIGALLAGVFTIFILSVVTDIALEKNGLLNNRAFGSNALWVIILVIACRCLFFMLGGLLTAKLAPNKPFTHALLLGIISVIFNTMGAVMMWNIAPHWFPITLLILGFISCLIGGKLKRK